MLSACSPFTTIVNSSGEQPTPVVSYSDAPTGYQPITVDKVEVEVGVGSPIPVFVIVSGNLPDPCSQVEHTEIKQDGSNFIINLFATPDKGGPAVDSCIKDPIPFTMSIPLNVIDLPAGSYSVTVNGSRADFKLDTANTNSSLRTADMSFEKSDIQVDDVNIEVGVVPTCQIPVLNWVKSVFTRQRQLSSSSFWHMGPHRPIVFRILFHSGSRFRLIS